MMMHGLMVVGVTMAVLYGFRARWRSPAYSVGPVRSGSDHKMKYCEKKKGQWLVGIEGRRGWGEEGWVLGGVGGEG